MTEAAIDRPLRLAWMAARLIPDECRVFVGIGAPCCAAMLARRIHASGIDMIFESGVMGADPEILPLSTGSPSVAAGAAMVGSMLEVFATLQRGEVDLGLLSGAQVDRKGNLNSTIIGDPAAPRLRLPGSGGAHDIATLARDVVILMPHEPRRFVDQVDFVTSPGHLPGRAAATGLGNGPLAVVTDRALFRFTGGEMTLVGRYADLDEDDAVEHVGWLVRRADPIEVIDPPSVAITAAFKSFSGETT